MVVSDLMIGNTSQDALDCPIFNANTKLQKYIEVQKDIFVYLVVGDLNGESHNGTINKISRLVLPFLCYFFDNFAQRIFGDFLLIS